MTFSKHDTRYPAFSFVCQNFVLGHAGIFRLKRHLAILFVVDRWERTCLLISERVDPSVERHRSSAQMSENILKIVKNCREKNLITFHKSGKLKKKFLVS